MRGACQSVLCTLSQQFHDASEHEDSTSLAVSTLPGQRQSDVHPATTGTLPATLGTYLLHLHLPRPRTLAVGRLGWVCFPAGDYTYVGSALGPGGLRARLGRHLRGGGRPRWHVDALRAVARVKGYCFEVSDQSLECRWSQTLAALPEAFIPAPGFGSSDCRSGCAAHLIGFSNGLSGRSIRRSLASSLKRPSFDPKRPTSSPVVYRKIDS